MDPAFSSSLSPSFSHQQPSTATTPPTTTSSTTATTTTTTTTTNPNTHDNGGATPYHFSPPPPSDAQGPFSPPPSFFHPDTPMQLDRATAAHSTNLSLNLSSLSMTSPTNLSPINPSPLASTATSGMSPVTPISPGGGIAHASPFHTGHHAHFHPPPHGQFSYAPPDPPGLRFDDPSGAGAGAHARIGLSSRSSSASDKSVPRKRSFTAATPLAPSVEEHHQHHNHNHNHNQHHQQHQHQQQHQHAGHQHALFAPHDSIQPASTPYDEVDMVYSSQDPGGSPADGSGSDGDDAMRVVEPTPPPSSSGQGGPSLQAAQMGVIGKPMTTNNFVTKLYQMINDAKSAHFIAWTDLGTSFVVSNVGEFSRSILGSHFKHNNFSSFVRQLNMYGFHKINRTPRAQRTSTDAQTWEFSHHKFLRGRPDLLDEIKRKALEPDPSVKHRVELPGEVQSQLNQMRDENRRVTAQLAAERLKVERLASLTKVLYDVVDKNFPGWLPTPFPADLIDAATAAADGNPNIFVTSPHMGVGGPHGASFPTPLSSAPSLASSLHSLSPASSPTAADFGHLPQLHHHQPSQSLSRQPSFSQQHQQHQQHQQQSSPGGGGGGYDDFTTGTKRPRTQAVAGKRARSDSAPLGYGGFSTAWTTTRPRSGSGLARRDEMVQSIAVGSMGRGGAGHLGQMTSLPPPSLPTLPKPSP